MDPPNDTSSITPIVTLDLPIDDENYCLQRDFMDKIEILGIVLRDENGNLLIDASQQKMLQHEKLRIFTTMNDTK